jgi:hypothetical protein
LKAKTSSKSAPPCVTENAAKTRVSRATEKLRRFFSKRGLPLSTTALAGVISAHGVQAAPVGLAASVTLAALQGTALSASTLTLIQTTLKIMAWTKLNTAVIAGVITLLAAGTANVLLWNDGHPSIFSALRWSFHLPRTSPVPFAGYATPEASLQSLLWAAHTGNLEKVLDSCTQAQAQRFGHQMSGKTRGEVEHDFAAWAHSMIGYQITQRDVIADDEVRLLLLVQPYPGHPNVGHDLQVMRKTGNDWKYAGKWGVDIKEN